MAKDEYGTMTLTWSTNAAPERKQLPTERYFQRAAKQRLERKVLMVDRQETQRMLAPNEVETFISVFTYQKHDS